MFLLLWLSIWWYLINFPLFPIFPAIPGSQRGPSSYYSCEAQINIYNHFQRWRLLSLSFPITNSFFYPTILSVRFKELIHNWVSPTQCIPWFISSVFWTDFGQNFKFQVKKEICFPCILKIYNHKKEPYE